MTLDDLLVALVSLYKAGKPAKDIAQGWAFLWKTNPAVVKQFTAEKIVNCAFDESEQRLADFCEEVRYHLIKLRPSAQKYELN